MPPTSTSRASSLDDGFVDVRQLGKRKLKHGFKAHAKRVAARVRRESGHDLFEPLDVDAVAGVLQARVVGLTADLRGLVEARHLLQLTEIDTAAFSGVTVPLSDDRSLVLVNDSHDEVRQRSSIAHEFGHIALAHRSPPPFSEHGCREVDADVEAEAMFFGSVLLVPEPAVMKLVRQGLSIEAAAGVMQVSTAMMQWRVNAEGASRRLRR